MSDSTTTTPTTDPVTVRLTELKVDSAIIEKIKGELGASSVEELVGLTEADLVGAGMKALPARKLLSTLKGAAVSTATAAGAVSAVSFTGVLPAVPDDTSWLAALKAGGVLKVDTSTVISAVRAALAHRAGLFEIPKKLAGRMETFADENADPVDPEFFRLRKQLTRTSYAEIFEAIDGLDGSFVTEGRKQQLLARVDEKLWPAIMGFHHALVGWQETWAAGAGNPAVMMSAIASLVGGGGAGVMPPGMVTPPDTGILRDNADAVADAVNSVFSGTGVQIAAALGHEATKISQTLANPRLPALIGAANRDQMLRQLGVAVNATYPRLEVNLVQFVLAVLEVKNQPGGNDELRYFGALFMLGNQIPWDTLGSGPTGRPTGIGGRVTRSRDEL